MFTYSKLRLLLFYVYPSTCTELAKPSDMFGVPATWLLLSIVMGLTTVDNVRFVCSAIFFFFLAGNILRKPVFTRSGTGILIEHSP